MLEENDKHKQIRILVVLDALLSNMEGEQQRQFNTDDKLVGCLLRVATQAPDQDVRRKCRALIRSWSDVHSGNTRLANFSKLNDRITTNKDATAQSLQKRELSKQAASRQRELSQGASQQGESSKFQQAGPSQQTSPAQRRPPPIPPARRRFSQQTISPTAPTSATSPTSPTSPSSLRESLVRRFSRASNRLSNRSVENLEPTTEYEALHYEVRRAVRNLRIVVDDMEWHRHDPSTLYTMQDTMGECIKIKTRVEARLDSATDPTEIKFLEQDLRALEVATDNYNKAWVRYAGHTTDDPALTARMGPLLAPYRSEAHTRQNRPVDDDEENPFNDPQD
ncbi:hypothetical protein K470DRAFT_257817 [Piedraia hortae CBS 480.64]|uniref:VHS domain-containing protein n=1 Tax=Piedraia hortae CBS 480.64 TaxID=1314780 RepID=A0A6A7BZB4_9PEZI|nr:hypothetical protein K470DRAFT_257817 [Piedraia hortae CBS 480.64]